MGQTGIITVCRASTIERYPRPRVPMPTASHRHRVQMINLGCAKNVVDAEEMLGVLVGHGWAIAPPGEDADVLVVNTCGFIGPARAESTAAVQDAVRRKRQGRAGRVVVTGCMVQHHAGELAERFPAVDAFMGPGRMAEIANLVEPDAHGTVTDAEPHHRWLDGCDRVLSTPPWTAYLKISEGCDHDCTFCTIPSIRGRHQSKPMDRILAEAAGLVSRGVRELNLIAQDSTQYGYDVRTETRLPELLRELSPIIGDGWLRLLYCHPSRMTSKVIEAIAETPGVCRYVDIPLQHSEDQLLRSMRRPANGGRYLEQIRALRESSPDIAIRTTFIVGFPGETEERFADLLRFVEQAQFDRVGVFEYSDEPGAASSALPDKVPPAVIARRKDRLMRLQQPISLGRNRAWIGRDIDVLVEGMAAPTGRTRRSEGLKAATPTGLGRSYRDAPEIDGSVVLTGPGARLGEFVTARVTDADVYDLVASVTAERGTPPAGAEALAGAASR